MTSTEYLTRVNEILGGDGTGLVYPGSDKPWAIQWDCGGVDPFTDELPITRYHTSAEALRAASSLHNPYNPSDFPQTTEPVTVTKHKAQLDSTIDKLTHERNWFVTTEHPDAWVMRDDQGVPVVSGYWPKQGGESSLKACETWLTNRGFVRCGDMPPDIFEYRQE